MPFTEGAVFYIIDNSHELYGHPVRVEMVLPNGKPLFADLSGKALILTENQVGETPSV